MRADSNIPRKANKILNLVLLSFFLILIRVWYLEFVQRDFHDQQARKPKRKTVIQKVERATIRDRFNIPLSQNKISYNATIRYADLREIPSNRWEKDENGVKVKKPVRSVYISSLADLLSRELKMDSQAIEDLIYAKASMFPHTPFIIKENLTEQEYYRVRMLQKDWRGIEAERVSKREYPYHKVACDILGYMGAINSREYLQIAEETKTLQEYIKKRELGEIVFLPDGYESPLEVRSRLKILKEKAYRINDQIGKTGIEGFCDEILRGVHGRTMYEMDPRGNILRELPGVKKGESGQRVFLAISAELQEYTEGLLAEHEAFRDSKDKNGELIPGTPWIKGGAAIALNPKTGEILAMASYPRFDPNDFTPAQTAEVKKEKQSDICKWLENDKYIGDIWDGKVPLTRERYSQLKEIWSEESQPLTWKHFLGSILPPDSSTIKALAAIETVENAYYLQNQFEELKKKAKTDNAAALIQAIYSDSQHVSGKKKVSSDVLEFIQRNLIECGEDARENIRAISQYLHSVRYNDDKLLVLDLIGLLVSIDKWDRDLIEEIGHLSLADFLELSQAFKKAHDKVKQRTQELHHEIGFKEWRENHFKDFLKQKRKDEKLHKRPAKPYTEYLEKIEKNFFNKLWDGCKLIFLDAALYQNARISVESYPQLKTYLNELISIDDISFSKLRQVLGHLNPEQAIKCMKCMRSFEDLTRPLYGKYRFLRNENGVQLEKHLAAAFYPLSGYGYGRSQAFRHSTPHGSVFKIAVAYEALKERYEYLVENHLSLKDLNPLTVVDLIQMNATPGSLKQVLGYTLDGEPIRRLYKGGVLPRTHPNIGKIDLPNAIEQSSNLYFALLASEHMADPSCLERASRDLGLGSKTGIDLPGEIKGHIPEDLADNKTGLYSFAMGQHSLIATPLQTAVMYGAFAGHGEVLKPQIISLIAGKKTSEDPFLTDYSSNNSSAHPFQDSLMLAGVDFPLFTESLSPAYNPLIHEVPVEVKRTIFLPEEIRTILLDGMNRVVTGVKGTAKYSSIRYLREFPKAAKEFRDLQGQFVGKTGTAEILYKHWIDAESKAIIRNHIWFAGIVFPDKITDTGGVWGEGELVVIVFLKYSRAGGKEAAPIGTQMAAKWREIQKKHGASSYIEKIAPQGTDGLDDLE
jgi:cell division protein FtsI/penicillin-binding protein 2